MDMISPEDFAAEAQRWLEKGVQLIGGCCGIGPVHIRLLRERLPAHSSSGDDLPAASSGCGPVGGAGYGRMRCRSPNSCQR